MTYTLTDLNHASSSFSDDVIDGLSQDQKTLDCMYLYDSEGVVLFNKICQLKEYYITRLENRMLAANGQDICQHIPDNSHIIEYGCGSADKIRFLFEQAGKTCAYTAIDISMDYLSQACEQVSAAYPHLKVQGICGDYLNSQLPITTHENAPRVVFFPGSTIGNLDTASINKLIDQSRAHVGEGGWFFLGVDLVKPIEVLLAAYDDSEGVTANFNLNLLTRINSELGADFQREQFRHEARWNAIDSRIEMHIVSLADQTVIVDGEAFAFAEGESIFTESSYKFTPETIRKHFANHGYQLKQSWQDKEGWFGHFLFQLVR